MSESSKAVFLSYASQDADAARRICDALRAAGIEVWFDQSELRGGDAWDRQMRERIHDCRLFIAVISANSEIRDEGYFRREWRLAVDRTNDMADDRPFLVPVAIDETSERGARVPESFKHVQWTRLPGGETPPAFVERVARLLSPAPSEATGPNRARTPTPSTSHPRVAAAAPGKGSRLAPLLIGALVLLGGGYFALDRFVISKHSAASSPGASAPSAMPGKSIAVLPFADMSEKKDQEYFGDGMAEEIIDLLTKVPGLTIIGRTSSFQFKGKNEDLRTIGAKLNAAYILEGSVRNSGEQVRITAQLINTRTGAHEWSETYDRRFGDVLKLQDAIALAVVRQLQLTVIPADLDSRAALKNTEAYGLMLRGRHAFDRLNKEGYDEAASLFQQALNRDPTLADAASWLGRVYETQGESGFLSSALAYEQSRRLADLALKLEPRNAEAHALLANIHIVYDWDWAAAEREIQQARSIAPGDPYVRRAGAILSMALGRWDEALRQIKSAAVIDPIDPINYVFMWQLQDRMGQLAEAEASVRRMLDISPTYGWGRTNLAYLLLRRGDRDAALSEVQQEVDGSDKQLGMAMVLYALGRRAESDAALAWCIKESAGTQAYGIGDLYALRGQSDEAMRWLERAYTQKDSQLMTIKVDTALVPLNGDPRYKALLRKLKLPEA